MDSRNDGTLGPQQPGSAREVAGETASAVKAAATDIAETAKDQVGQVTAEVKQQTRNVAAEVRDRVAEQARAQHDNLADGIRRLADEMAEMAQGRPESPARTVVSRVAQGGHDLADYLGKRGPDGVLAEVREFARRRPGAFLATALVSGFVVGRVGRGVISAAGQPDTAGGAAAPDSLSQFSAVTAPNQRASTAMADADELVYSTSTTKSGGRAPRKAAR